MCLYICVWVCEREKREGGENSEYWKERASGVRTNEPELPWCWPDDLDLPIHQRCEHLNETHYLCASDPNATCLSVPELCFLMLVVVSMLPKKTSQPTKKQSQRVVDSQIEMHTGK